MRALSVEGKWTHQEQEVLVCRRSYTKYSETWTGDKLAQLLDAVLVFQISQYNMCTIKPLHIRNIVCHKWYRGELRVWIPKREITYKSNIRNDNLSTFLLAVGNALLVSHSTRWRESYVGFTHNAILKDWCWIEEETLPLKTSQFTRVCCLEDSMRSANDPRLNQSLYTQVLECMLGLTINRLLRRSREVAAVVITWS